jgi:hypothetical protein
VRVETAAACLGPHTHFISHKVASAPSYRDHTLNGATATVSVTVTSQVNTAAMLTSLMTWYWPSTKSGVTLNASLIKISRLVQGLLARACTHRHDHVAMTPLDASGPQLGHVSRSQGSFFTQSDVVPSRTTNSLLGYAPRTTSLLLKGFR